MSGDLPPFSIRVIDDLGEARAALTRRRGFEEPDLSERMQDGIRRVFGSDLSADEVVDRIIREVRAEGDVAVNRYTTAFDGRAPEQSEVPRAAAAWHAAATALDMRSANASISSPGRRAR